MLISTEERNKAKKSYQESLQNVVTVRQQAVVSHLTLSSLHFLFSTSDGPCTLSTSLLMMSLLGKVQILEKLELHLHRSPAHCIKDGALIASLTLCNAPYFLLRRGWYSCT